MPKLLFPNHVKDVLIKRYRSHHKDWLFKSDSDEWPLQLLLGSPREEEAQLQLDMMRDWVRTWQLWQGAGELVWCERRWRHLGVQRLPERLLLHTPEEVASWINKEHHWQRAHVNYQRLITRWPILALRLPYYFNMLESYSDENIQRLEGLLSWLEAHTHSNLYPRQLPIAGLDSKWLEERKNLIGDLLRTLQCNNTQDANFFESCGLKPLPHLIRLKILDPFLLQCLHGLSDITAPVEEIATLSLPVSQVFIVENLQTGLSFSDLSGAVVFMGLGYGVEVLQQISWLSHTKCIYWGDIDTHGFAILNRARAYLPHLQSILMDENTLLKFKNLWGNEEKQHAAYELPLLTAAEQSVYQGLKQQRWGTNIRLEQERIQWEAAWQIILSDPNRS